MAVIEFAVDVSLACPAPDVWNRLADWGSHGDWVPATRSRIITGDGGVGTEFEAITGWWPLRLVDRMRVRHFDAAGLRAEVEKVGPVLHGQAGFTVSALGPACTVHWFERVQVSLLPQWLAPLAAAISAAAFRHALGRLARLPV